MWGQKRGTSSQQDEAAHGRVNTRGRGSQQVLLLCLVQGYAGLTCFDFVRQGTTAGELWSQVLAAADYQQQIPAGLLAAAVRGAAAFSSLTQQVQHMYRLPCRARHS